MGDVSNIALICPPIRSFRAGAPPLYGTCSTCAPVAGSNCFAAMSWPVPMPALPIVTLPGLRLGHRDQVLHALGRQGADAPCRMLGWFTSRITGVKSLKGSKPGFLYRCMLAASTPELDTNKRVSVGRGLGGDARRRCCRKRRRGCPPRPACPAIRSGAWQRARATMSTLPPGGKGTISLTGPVG